MFLKKFIRSKIKKGACPVKRMRYLMGTFFEIEVTAENKDKAERITESAFSEIKRIENILSRYNPESELFHLNRTAVVSPVKVSPELFNLIELSLEYSSRTGGLFDLTVCPLMDLWFRTQQEARPPSSEEINRTLSLIGSDKVVLDPLEKTVFFKKKGMRIDFGGIGKGYALDKIVEVLKKNGARPALLNAGGQFYVLNLQPEFYPLGIENPLNSEEIVAVVELRNESMATSANNERFFSIGGKQYGHLINPLTGYPEEKMLSMSVISENAAAADVFSTALFLMGPEKGMKFMEGRQGMEGIIISKNGSAQVKIDVSSGLKNRVKSPYL